MDGQGSAFVAVHRAHEKEAGDGQAGADARGATQRGVPMKGGSFMRNAGYFLLMRCHLRFRSRGRRPFLKE